jgi:hypothetical protein
MDTTDFAYFSILFASLLSCFLYGLIDNNKGYEMLFIICFIEDILQQEKGLGVLRVLMLTSATLSQIVSLYVQHKQNEG